MSAMSAQDLSDAMRVAESEKAIWLRGRKAFKLHGLGAFNPYSDETDALHDLWEEGFNYERDKDADRRPRF
ncbi:hypothetical protein E3C22_03065 [Jiella endophytica]|uniref:Uncharacterized protein n=1 Tax=Jiella endophytica TaxID=2558362 RepID=A0A4Y8RU18_9HYPH|nr:hypothetical protein [Jiella endophytica]TFF27453.1 hypothetical protein E3C22_03065 [Jiella endophytica]